MRTPEKIDRPRGHMPSAALAAAYQLVLPGKARLLHSRVLHPQSILPLRADTSCRLP